MQNLYGAIQYAIERQLKADDSLNGSVDIQLKGALRTLHMKQSEVHQVHFQKYMKYNVWTQLSVELEYQQSSFLFIHGL